MQRIMLLTMMAYWLAVKKKKRLPHQIWSMGMGRRRGVEEPPIVESISCENSGVQTHPDYGDLPTFTIKSTVSDEDGDLTYYQLFVDIDGTLDGVEDENDTELNPVEGAVNDEECGVFDANLSVTIFLNGTMPEYDTVYEWYVRVADGLGKMSEPLMVECRTPDENGAGDPNTVD